jgi:hypothetical protein
MSSRPRASPAASANGEMGRRRAPARKFPRTLIKDVGRGGSWRFLELSKELGGTQIATAPSPTALPISHLAQVPNIRLQLFTFSADILLCRM